MGSKSEKEDARRQINAPCRRGKKGKIAQKSYTVFLGIELIFSDIHAESCERKSSEYGNFIEIEHCREGRAEHSFSDELIYLSPGDLTISVKNSKNKSSYFPLSHYHGVSVIIDLKKAPRCLTCFLDDVNVKPQIIADKFCANGKSYIARSNKSVEHIFSEIYSVPEEIKRGYFKIKVLELLLFLSCKNMPKSEEYRPTYSKSQADLAKAVCRYQTERMDEKITLAELCRRFQAAESFPHEIGLFLGYPAEDVQGFIINEAKCEKCTGVWKVYGDEITAKTAFEKYKKCTQDYFSRWQSGKSIEKLAVAC